MNCRTLHPTCKGYHAAHRYEEGVACPSGFPALVSTVSRRSRPCDTRHEGASARFTAFRAAYLASRLLGVAQKMFRPASSQACTHLRHASAQMRQCSCFWACLSHSSPHSRHVPAHMSIIRRMISRSDPVNRVAILPVTLQISAQSKFDRIHWRGSLTISSAKQASAQAMHICAQE